jgi:hypothetical protein
MTALSENTQISEVLFLFEAQLVSAPKSQCADHSALAISCQSARTCDSAVIFRALDEYTSTALYLLLGRTALALLSR